MRACRPGRSRAVPVVMRMMVVTVVMPMVVVIVRVCAWSCRAPVPCPRPALDPVSPSPQPHTVHIVRPRQSAGAGQTGPGGNLSCRPAPPQEVAA